MTVSLGGITLDENLILDGLEAAPDVAMSTVVTLGGLSVTNTMPLSGGRALSLVSLNSGDTISAPWLRWQLMSIKALAALGQPVTLIHHLGTFNVLIQSTAEVVPVIKYANPQDHDKYTGPIQLIEV